ncbi:MAG: hypothetical protein AB7G75_32390 [Candidatus Binatia bacterium]
MKMAKEDIKSFPKFSLYVRQSFPQVIQVKSIVHNLKAHGSLTTEEIRHAVQWGNDPLIVIKPLSNFRCNARTASPMGCFQQSAPNQIEVEIEYVKTYEQDPNGAGVGRNARGQTVYVVGVILLHEICHWGNFKHGVTESTEKGEAFEIATYGKRPVPNLVHVSEMTITE